MKEFGFVGTVMITLHRVRWIARSTESSPIVDLKKRLDGAQGDLAGVVKRWMRHTEGYGSASLGDLALQLNQVVKLHGTRMGEGDMALCQRLLKEIPDLFGAISAGTDRAVLERGWLDLEWIHQELLALPTRLRFAVLALRCEGDHADRRRLKRLLPMVYAALFEGAQAFEGLQRNLRDAVTLRARVQGRRSAALLPLEGGEEVELIDRFWQMGSVKEAEAVKQAGPDSLMLHYRLDWAAQRLEAQVEGWLDPSVPLEPSLTSLRELVDHYAECARLRKPLLEGGMAQACRMMKRSGKAATTVARSQQILTVDVAQMLASEEHEVARLQEKQEQVQILAQAVNSLAQGRPTTVDRPLLGTVQWCENVLDTSTDLGLLHNIILVVQETLAARRAAVHAWLDRVGEVERGRLLIARSVEHLREEQKRVFAAQVSSADIVMAIDEKTHSPTNLVRAGERKLGQQMAIDLIDEVVGMADELRAEGKALQTALAAPSLRRQLAVHVAAAQTLAQSAEADRERDAFLRVASHLEDLRAYAREISLLMLGSTRGKLCRAVAELRMRRADLEDQQ